MAEPVVRHSAKSQNGDKRATLRVYATHEERSFLKLAAGKAGVSVSKYLIDSALRGTRSSGISVSEAAELRSMILDTRRQLIGIATNLNQIAHHANATQEVSRDAQESARRTAVFVGLLEQRLASVRES